VRAMHYTVGELSRLCGLTVRTLHHYDEIGLLVPQGRTRAGYRQYGTEDITRLQQILYFRELGFGLGEIARVLEDPKVDRRQMLAMQRLLLTKRIRRLEAMVEAIDSAVEGNQEGTLIKMDDMKEIFGDFDPAEYEEEAKERWGNTDAYAESKRRTSAYGKEDWRQIMAEAKEIGAALGALCEAGTDPESAESMDAAERHRRHISDHFYACPPDMHAGLGDMYTTDARFTATWEEIAPGLTEFVRAAFRANAMRPRP